MRRTRRSGGFFLCLLLNLLLNWEGVIPAALLFALHRWRGWPLWWAGLVLALLTTVYYALSALAKVRAAKREAASAQPERR